MKLSSIFQRAPAWILSRRVTSFQKFFELGQEESASPFLDEQARQLSRNLMLKASLSSAVLLVVALLLMGVSFNLLWTIPLSFVYLFVGTPALVAAIDDVVDRHDVNIDVLTTVSAFGALAIDRPLEGGLLLVLFSLAGSLEDMVTLKAKGALCAIGEMAPTKACVVGPGGKWREKAVADVKVGEVVAVRAGEIVPFDGVVTRGEGSLSLAHLTGESRPLAVGVRQQVISGSRLLDGALEVEVQLTQGDSTVAKLIQLITRAHSSKPRLTTAFERWGRVYALSVILGAFGVMLLLPWVTTMSFSGDSGSVVRAVGFLITASPCALILAVPITYLSALGSAVRRGAILKGSVVLDRMVACNVVAFDKTGTLTEGVLALDEIVPLVESEPLPLETVRDCASALEIHAVHPVARAIVDACSQVNRPLLEVDQIHVIPGEGVEGVVMLESRQTKIFIGKIERALSCMGHKGSVHYDKEQWSGKSVAALAVPQRGVYVFVLGDRLRPQSQKVIEDLHALGKRVIMLSGDTSSNAQDVGRFLGIDEVWGGLVPENKLDRVAELSSHTGVVMVGDGINDAPALARATVGVSMGQLSSAAAREASDIVLLHNDVSILAWLFVKAINTRQIVIQNVCLACIAMSFGVITALTGFLPLWAAVIIHEGSTVIVGINALRLLGK